MATRNWELTTDSGLGATGSMAFNSILNTRYDEAGVSGRDWRIEGNDFDYPQFYMVPRAAADVRICS